MGTIILIIIGAGILGGIAQSILVPSEENYWKIHLPKSIILGITASAIVPLFLEMISSDLLNQTESDPYSYLVFASLCIVIATYSRKFISTIGDKVLNELEEAKKEANKALEQADEAKENVYEMASKYSEPVDEEVLKASEGKVDKEFKEPVNSDLIAITKALDHKKYNYRTVNSLAKETNVGNTLTETHLGTMKDFGLVKKIEYKDKPTLWSLTSRGRTFAKKKGDIEK